MKEIFYFDIVTGFRTESKPDWIYRNMKIPARDYKQAVQFYTMLDSYDYYARKKGFKFETDHAYNPSENYVFMCIRQVVEFEKIETPRYGKTRITFRQKKIYNSHELINFR